MLSLFESLSGQTINLDKCEVFFNKCLDGYYKGQLSSILGIKEVRSHNKYLGLPMVFLRSKRFSFSNLRDRIWKKLQGWKEKLLSMAGKEVLIKAVAQSIPTYAMSRFKLPSTFCSEVTIIRNFWWGMTIVTCNAIRFGTWYGNGTRNVTLRDSGTMGTFFIVYN